MFSSLVGWFLRNCSPPNKRRRPTTRRLLLEALEDRFAPAVLTVTSLADDGSPGTLRSILANANNGDTINFNVINQGGQTITLTSPLTTTANLTIDGGNTLTTIDAAQTGPLFVFGTAGDDVNETVNNLTLKNGLSNLGGGAITVYGSLTLTGDKFINNTDTSNIGGGAIWLPGRTTDSLTATGCTFTNNKTTGNGGTGGALEVTNASVALYSCGFSNNSANADGGAIYMNGGTQTGSLTAKNGCSFITNTVTGNNGVAAGGAIWTDGSLTVTGAGSQFEGNSAPTAGGAIFFQANGSSALSLWNATFQNNQAGDGGAVGILIDMNAGTVNATITRCLFNSNQATGASVGSCDGGGVLISDTLDGTASQALQITNSTFYNNSASNLGGGIYLTTDGNTTGNNTTALTSLTIYDNEANDYGGGLFIDDSNDPTTVTNPAVDNCIIAGNLNDSVADQGVDVYGAVLGNNSSEFDLIGQAGASAGNSGWGNNGCQLGSPANPLNPGLDPTGLQPNGGNPMTIKLVVDPTNPSNNSPAYQTGDNRLALAGATDQRGYKRVNPVSIGAYDPGATKPTVVQLNSSLNPAADGQSVTFTAVVMFFGSTLPTGTVSFEDGSSVLDTETLGTSDTVVSFTTSDLALGNHSITAVYSGDSLFTTSTSAVLTQSIITSVSETVSGFTFSVWVYPGDTLSSVDWLITSAAFGGTTEASGTASGTNISSTVVGTNVYGFQIDTVTVSLGSSVSLSSGTYWLQLQNAVVPSGDPVYWSWSNGPSQAYENSLGDVSPNSSWFTIWGSSGSSNILYSNTGVNPGSVNAWTINYGYAVTNSFTLA